MRFPRSSGILLHPTSLPGRYGIGDLGPEAHRFIDWLASAGQSLWQVLPLGPTSFGDSPYQLFSAFAGNPRLIDLEQLVGKGWLAHTDLDAAPAFPAHKVDYGGALDFKWARLKKAADAFNAAATAAERADFTDFTSRYATWLDDFALFMAVKEAHNGAVWTRWEEGIAGHEPAAVERWASELAGEVFAHKFAQWIFFHQWNALRGACHERDIRIMGDLPIYVAHDSADVWANRELFLLDAKGEPLFVAGVPPDYFSATGQLWGNPIYRWDEIARRGYGWWIARLRATLLQVDMLRLDHFRGFEAYWQVPAGEPTAMHGEWVKGPGAHVFEAAQAVLGELPIVAENLGVITPEVEAIRERLGFPGMAILQFAFGKDPQGPSFRPHNYPRHLVAYTGTHDNDTTEGWWTSSGAGDSTRTPQDIVEERDFTCRYLGTDGHEINWVFIRTLLASVADTVLFPLQDVLGLDSEARMNVPARPWGNWTWRCEHGTLTPELQKRLKDLTKIYDR